MPMCRSRTTAPLHPPRTPAPSLSPRPPTRPSPFTTPSPRPQQPVGPPPSPTPGGGGGGFGGIDPLPLGPTDQQLSTGFCEPRQQLRQEIAARLDQAEGRPVVRVRIGMTFESRTAE